MKLSKITSPQLALSTAAIAGLVTGAALLTIPSWWLGENNPGPHAVQIHSEKPINRYEVEAVYRRELTLQAWLETMTRTAQGEPEEFESLLGSTPSMKCTDAHWPPTSPGESPEPPKRTDIEAIFICNRVSAVSNTAPEPQWEQKLRDAAALLWQGTNPEGAISLEIARQGYHATSEDNAQLAAYMANFQVCRTDGEMENWLATPKGKSRQAASNWLTLARSYELCIQRIEEEMFPIDHE